MKAFVRSTGLALLFVSFALCFGGCSSPEKRLERAEAARSKSQLESLARKFTDTDVGQAAAARLREIDAWAKAMNGTRLELDQYLDAYPNGLYVGETRAAIQEIDDLAIAKDADMIDAYEAFLAKYSSAPYADSLRSRIGELMTVSAKYADLPDSSSLEHLVAFAREHRGTGYSRAAAERADRLAWSEASRRVLAKKDNAAALETLRNYDGETPIRRFATSSRVAWRTVEDIAIEQMEITGPELRFALPGIVVHSDNDPYRFSFSTLSFLHPDSASYFRAGNLDRVTKSAGVVADSIRLDGDMRVQFTELPGDVVPIVVHVAQLGYGLVLAGEGEHCADRLEPIDHAAGSVWRFHGPVQMGNDLLVTGDPLDPLCFYLTDRYGPTYLRGKGRVEDRTGRVLFRRE